MRSADYSITQIASIVNGKVVQEAGNFSIFNLLLDSRLASPSEGTLFLALKGERHDGHQHLQSAYDKGVRSFLVSHEDAAKNLIGINLVVVENTLEALQQLASHHRRQFNYPMVAITGSNGKTIVKEWLNQLLSDDYNIIRSPKSYNSQVGVPISLLGMEAHHEMAILEAGISKPGEMSKLAEMIQPDWGIFVNVLTAHRENFRDKQHLANEKARLFSSCKKVIFNSAYSSIDRALQEFCPEVKTARWSTSDTQADYHFELRFSGDETLVRLIEDSSNFNLPFADEASIENALHCIVFLTEMGIESDEIASRLQNLAPVEMRMELLDGNEDCQIISDVYSADLDSLKIALEFQAQHCGNRERALVLSDLLQTGLSDENLIQKVSELLSQYPIHTVYTVGSKFGNLPISGASAHHHFESADKLLAADLDKFSGKSVLIKSARKFRLERLTQQLSQKLHDTILEIDLRAMSNNLNTYRSKLKGDTRIMAMVKAQGYGNGSERVASMLEFNRVDYLGVAYPDEGIELRKSGVSMPIMVMNPSKHSWKEMLDHRLEPEIYSVSLLESLHKFMKNRSEDEAIKIHLKVETGMNRLGLDADSIPAICHLLRNDTIRVVSCFTHLAGSDDASFDDFTHQQIKIFETFSDVLSKALTYSFFKHVLNSAGISRFPEYQMDMVRLGIGLYGLSGDAAFQSELEHVSTLKTYISQVKTVNAGETVGYNPAFKLEGEKRIATVPVGYADGLLRALGNGKGHLVVGGILCPIVGNVCMDMCMIDVSDTQAREGDEVIVFGKEQSIDKLAQSAGTISYELLTAMSSRVKRVYLQD